MVYLERRRLQKIALALFLIRSPRSVTLPMTRKLQTVVAAAGTKRG